MIRVVSTAAGSIIGPTVEKIDRMLACPSDRYMMDPGDIDALLDARLQLVSET